MSIVKDGIIGHAIGDAMGVPIEFESRARLLENPVTEMTGGGTHGQPKGYFSDDTSMEIATIDSYIKKEKFDYDDIMNNFSLWITEGKFTPGGKAFDAGITCYNAINNYLKGTPPLESGLNKIDSNGNGSLMRMLPAVYYAHYKKLKQTELLKLTKNLSGITHRHEISILGCYLYNNYLLNIINGKDKYAALNMLKVLDLSSFSEESISKYKRLFENRFEKINIQEIRSTGYVVDTLEAVIWIILNTNNFKQAIIGAINLGDDTDTVGAITGSIAGILYGYNDIPKSWLKDLVKRNELEEYSKSFEKVLLKKERKINLIIEDNRMYKMDNRNNIISEVEFKKISKDTYDITKVYVDPLYRGKGEGNKIFEKAYKFLKSKNYKVTASCEFASQKMKDKNK